MADSAISPLTAASALTGAEIVPCVQSSNTRRTTAQAIANLATAVETSFTPVGGLAAANVQAVLEELDSEKLAKAVVPVTLIIAASDETTALTAGTAKVTFRMPHAMTLTEVRASLSVAQASGSILTVDINKTGMSGSPTILSTKITIDNAEKTSVTADVPPVISDSALADDAEMIVDIDQVGDGTAKGLKVTLIGTRAV